MKVWLGLLGALFSGRAAFAGDPVGALSTHLGKTPSLVVAVCEGGDADLAAIAAIVDQTP